MDSLRFWVLEMHVDGFRFDLAPVLARELYEVNRLGTFFDIIQQDPVLSQVKLIAEPWDVGPGGYQVGNFPVGWAEWNGRTATASVGSGAATRVSPGALGEPATPRSTSSRRTTASPCRTSSRSSRSTTRRTARATGTGRTRTSPPTGGWRARRICRRSKLRERMKRNPIATSIFSQGVRMLLGGDEIARTQRGNNNAYGQDNEVSWFDWEHRDKAMLNFTRSALRIFRSNPVLRRRSFFSGTFDGGGRKDVMWVRLSGEEMTDEDWADPRTGSSGC